MPSRGVTDEERERFDAILEELLPELPPRVQEVMEEVPLIVEDQPDARMMREMRLRRASELLGLYHGVSIDERSILDGPHLGDVIYLFRLGLLREARRGAHNEAERDARLREEIRKTILHEIGHYHGMDEEELEDLGY